MNVNQLTPLVRRRLVELQRRDFDRGIRRVFAALGGDDHVFDAFPQGNLVR